MAQTGRLLDLFEGKRNQKLTLTIAVLIVLILELLIYLAAASQAGQKSRVIILDTAGNKVYETPGSTLTSYEKLVFENTFGPLSNYRIKIQTDEVPFPFRAWLSAAVGIPIGLVLLMAFLVRAYLSLVYGEEEGRKEASQGPAGHGRLGSMAAIFHRISVFHIGFLVVVGVLLFWIVPNFLGDFATISIATIREFKWFFLGAAIFVAMIIVWVIYLRYKLSKEMLKNQRDIEKYRLEIQLLEHNKKEQPLLSSPEDETTG